MMRNLLSNLKRAVHRPMFYASLGLIALVAAAISFFSGINFLITVPIIVIAMFVNAMVMDIEDNAPGGFLNPTKEQTGLNKEEQ